MKQAAAPCLFEANRHKRDPSTSLFKVCEMDQNTIKDTSFIMESLYSQFPDPVSDKNFAMYREHWEKSPIKRIFHLPAYALLFKEHPDVNFRKAVAAIITFGAFIGYVGPRKNVYVSSSNYVHDPDDIVKVREMIEEDEKMGRILRLPPNKVSEWVEHRPLVISPLGAVAKGDPREKNRRIVVDASLRATGDHLNNNKHKIPDFISVNYHSLPCASPLPMVEEFMRLIALIGRGALIASVDFSAAYKDIQIAESDLGLFAFKENGSSDVLISRTNIFGGINSFAMYDIPARAHDWLLRRSHNILFSRYSDDTGIVGGETSIVPKFRKLDHTLLGLSNAHAPILSCSEALNVFLSHARSLGYTIAEKKVKAPCTRMKHLGWIWDTMKMTVAAPSEKIEHAKNLLLTACYWC